MALAATNRKQPALTLLLGLGIILAGASCESKAPPPANPADAGTAAGDPDPPAMVSVAHAAVGLTWENPDGWGEIEAVMASRLMTWQPPIGGESVQTFAFSFGDRFNQTVAQNTRRWATQMRLDDGTLPEPQLETWDQGGLHVTLATFESKSIIGMSLSDLELGAEGVRLLGVIIEGGPKGVLLFRLSGPAAIVEELKPGFLGMIRSVKPLDDDNEATAP